MRVLLIGEYYSPNLGDAVLCNTVRHIIEEEFPEAIIVPYDISGRKDYRTNYEADSYPFFVKKHLCLFKWCPRLAWHIPMCCALKIDEMRYVRSICLLEDLLKDNEFDLAIFAGGSIFMDYFAVMIYYITRRLSVTKTKVLFHACGMSNLSEHSRKLLNRAFKRRNVKWISLRDSYSKFCKIFHLKNKKVYETYDTALFCEEFFVPAKQTIAEYGIGVIEKPECFEQLKSVTAYCIENKLSWKLFSNGSGSDNVVLMRLAEELKIPQERIVCPPETAEDLVRVVTSFEKIISFRMHSQIVASSFGIPSFGFVWDKKITDFYDKLGFSECYAQVGDCVNGDYIKERVCGIASGVLQQTAKTQGKASKESLVSGIRWGLSH